MDFIAGFIAGEGCFTVKLRSTDTCRYGIQFIPGVSIKLHKRDSAILTEIQDSLDMGNIHKTEQMVGFQITGYQNCNEFIEQLDEVNSTIWYTSDKYETYCEWRDFVLSYSYPDSESEAVNMIKIAKELNHGDKGLSVDTWTNRITTT